MRFEKFLVLTSVLLIGGLVRPVAADVVFPALDVMDLGPDLGVTQSGSVLGFDGTAFQIVTTGAPLDIVDVPFTLTAGKLTLVGGTTYASGSGTFQAGSLLSGSFTSMTVNRIFFAGQTLGTYSVDVLYTGGSLAGNLASGRIEGTFSGAGNLNFAGNFTASTLILKGGQVVVPLPAAAWLFGAGLFGLAGLRRRA